MPGHLLAVNPAAYNAASENGGVIARPGMPVEVWGWTSTSRWRRDRPIEVAEEIPKSPSVANRAVTFGISDNKQRAKIATRVGEPAGIYRLTDANWVCIMGDRTVEAL